jgi:hypothetical protein
MCCVVGRESSGSESSESESSGLESLGLESFGLEFSDSGALDENLSNYVAISLQLLNSL